MASPSRRPNWRPAVGARHHSHVGPAPPTPAPLRDQMAASADHQVDPITALRRIHNMFGAYWRSASTFDARPGFHCGEGNDGGRAVYFGPPALKAGQMTDAGTGEKADFAEMIRLIAETRDRQAFQAIYLHFGPRLKSFLQRGGADPGVAEEVVQETMINVWRKASLFDPAKAAVSTWIFTIARNARISQIRRQNRPEPDHADPAFAPDPTPQPLDIVAREQDAERVKRAVAELPAEQQDVLKLAFFEDQSHSAVANALDLPLGTVKSRIRLALQRIRADLGDS